jgi:hypothetical protein
MPKGEDACGCFGVRNVWFGSGNMLVWHLHGFVKGVPGSFDHTIGSPQSVFSYICACNCSFPFVFVPDVDFRFKMDTDLYALAKSRAVPTSLSISPDGEHFAVTATDYKARDMSLLPL